MNNQQPTNLGFGNFFGGNVPSISMNGGNQPPQENVKNQGFHDNRVAGTRTCHMSDSVSDPILLQTSVLSKETIFNVDKVSSAKQF